MSITRINTNAEAIFSRVAIQRLERSMNRSMSHISSGLRLTSASDDPSSLSIWNNARAELSGVRTAIQNTQDSLAMLGTADKTMASMLDKLIQMRDLSVRCANDATLSDDDQKALSNEYAQLYTDVYNFTGKTFNGVNLLNKTAATGLANATGLKIQVGPAFDDVLTMKITKGISAGGSTVAGKALNITDLTGATTNPANAINQLDAVITAWAGQEALLGGNMRIVESKLSDLQNSETNQASVVATVGDADIAAELTDFTRSQILSQAATAMMAQANLQSSSMLNLLMG